MRLCVGLNAHESHLSAETTLLHSTQGRPQIDGHVVIVYEDLASLNPLGYRNGPFLIRTPYGRAKSIARIIRECDCCLVEIKRQYWNRGAKLFFLSERAALRSARDQSGTHEVAILEDFLIIDPPEFLSGPTRSHDIFHYATNTSHGIPRDQWTHRHPFTHYNLIDILGKQFGEFLVTGPVHVDSFHGRTCACRLGGQFVSGEGKARRDQCAAGREDPWHSGGIVFGNCYPGGSPRSTAAQRP